MRDSKVSHKMGNANSWQRYMLSEYLLVEACITYERNTLGSGEGVAAFGLMAADVLG